MNDREEGAVCVFVCPGPGENREEGAVCLLIFSGQCDGREEAAVCMLICPGPGVDPEDGAVCVFICPELGKTTLKSSCLRVNLSITLRRPGRISFLGVSLARTLYRPR